MENIYIKHFKAFKTPDGFLDGTDMKVELLAEKINELVQAHNLDHNIQTVNPDRSSGIADCQHEWRTGDTICGWKIQCIKCGTIKSAEYIDEL